MASKDTASAAEQSRRLLAYVAELELEVDRLRKHCHFVHQAVWDEMQTLHKVCGAAEAAGAPLGEIHALHQRLTGLLRDLRDPPGYHPAHDQVIAIAIRPLIEQVFRWHQRLENAPQATLELSLASDHLEWFPARLRHILSNLLSNALKYRDPAKNPSWVRVSLRGVGDGYEFQVADNGLGLSAPPANTADLFYRHAPAEVASLGVGLAVVKMLVEQSGGAVATDSGAGQGTTVTVTLPRYDLTDFLT